MKITRENLTMISTKLRVQNKEDIDKIFDKNLEKIETLSDAAARVEENLDFILDPNIEKIDQLSDQALGEKDETLSQGSSDEVKDYSEECPIERNIQRLFITWDDKSKFKI